MNKEEYLKQLSKYLSKLPKEDYEDAISYFEECFDDVGVEGEQRLIEELGSPRSVATEVLSNLMTEKVDMVNSNYSLVKYSPKDDDSKTIKEDKVKFKNKKEKKSIWNIVLIAILCILAAPIGMPLMIALFAVVFSLVVTVGALIISAGAVCLSGFVVAVKLFVVGLFTFSISPSGAIILVGSSFISVAIGLIMMILIFLFVKFLIYCLKSIVGYVSNKRRS